MICERIMEIGEGHTLQDLHNSSDHTQPHPVIAKSTNLPHISPTYNCAISTYQVSAEFPWLENSIC